MEKRKGIVIIEDEQAVRQTRQIGEHYTKATFATKIKKATTWRLW